VVIGVLLVLSAMGLSLVLLSMSETMATANTKRADAALYAAQAGIERVLPDLAQLADWDDALEGRMRSGFSDGAPSGERMLPGGARLVLDEVLNLANCGTRAPCSAAAMDAVTAGRPWGANNPRWRLFAYGPLAAIARPTEWPPTEYLVVLVADDPAESDGDPSHDGRGASAGAGLILLRAEAFGGESSRRVIEVTAARGPTAPRAAGYAAQRGEGTTTGGAPVQVPGGHITRIGMTLDGGFAR
jgi:hypothetical protein